ncbi:MAG TPA: BlaI/MecI/CopY family transcriptional regulator [Aeromonadales bacterium]|nr:BlaI/MecI/CopY family transcriptional regulator [Aeromonadales bacterium]
MKISDSEKKVMDVLWQSPSITAKAIIRQLDPNLGWQDRTVKTLINRLLKKNAIGFKKKGREYLYFSKIDKEDYIKSASDNFLQRVFNGSVSSLVSTFAKKEKLSKADIESLKTLIKEIEKDG